MQTQNQPLSDEQLNQLKNRLPKGYYRRLDKIGGWSGNQISAFFRGEYFDTNLLDHCLDLIEEKDRKIEVSISKLNKVLNC